MVRSHVWEGWDTQNNEVLTSHGCGMIIKQRTWILMSTLSCVIQRTFCESAIETVRII
jgi:hypothetical protein